MRHDSAGRAPLVLHRGEQAAQDVDLVLVHLAALEQAADARHEVRAALRAVAEVHLVHDLLQVRVEALHVGARRQRHRRLDSGRSLAGLPAARNSS